MSVRILFKIIIVLSLINLTPFDSKAKEVEKFDINYDRNSELLPYNIETISYSSSGNSSYLVIHPVHVIKAKKTELDSALYLRTYNPLITSDNPSIFSYKNYTSGMAIDDNPIKMTLQDSYFQQSQDLSNGLAIAVTYKNDSAFFVRNRFGTESFDTLFLCTGEDMTGDGKWLPYSIILLVEDYDYDGAVEAFIYVNAERDMSPRELFCVNIESMTIEWSLPVASLLQERNFLNCRDSLNPSIIFTTYNVKQGAVDENFSDLYAYLVKVNYEGKIEFKKIISLEHGTIGINRGERDDYYYVFHSVPFFDDNNINEDYLPVFTLSKIDKNGNILSADTSKFMFRDVWVGDFNHDNVSDIFSLSADGVVKIYDNNLDLLKRSSQTNFTHYNGNIILPGLNEEAFVFNEKDGGMSVYSHDFSKLAVFDHSVSYFEPFEYNESGEPVVYLSGSGNTVFIFRILERSFAEYVQIIFLDYQNYFVIVLVLLLSGLLIINYYRIRTLKNLRETDKEFQLFQSNLPVGYFRSNSKGEIVDVNQALIDILGFDSKEEFKEFPIDNFFRNPNERNKIRRQLLENKLITNLEIYSKKKDGSPMLTVNTVRAYFDKDGNIISIEGIVVDITEQRKAKEELQLQAEIVEHMAEGVSLTQVEKGIIVYANPTFNNMFGYESEELVGKKVEILNAPGDISPEDTSKEIITSLNKYGNWRGEVHNIRKDGTVFWSHANVSTLDHPIFGKVWVSVHNDITARKEAEDALRSSEELNSAININSPLGISVRNRHGKLLSVNDSWKKIWDVSDDVLYDDLMRERTELKFDKSDEYLGQWKNEIKKIYEQGGSLHVPDVKMLKPSIYRKWISQYFYAIKDVKGEVDRVVIITEDVTKRKLAQEQVDISFESQKILNELLGISLENIPLKNQLEKFLKTLVDIPFLKIQPKGAIFLAEGKNSLKMAASINLNPSLMEACQVIPFGECLCGRAALENKIQFSSTLINNHETRYVGIEPHGHYCLPVSIKGKVLGVLNLYLPENHKRDNREEKFLIAVANTLAGLVERKQYEEKLLLLSSSVDQSKEGLAVVDTKGYILFCNQSIAEMHGYTTDELLGKNLSIFHNENQMPDVKAANKIINETGEFVGEIWHARKDGTTFISMMHITVLTDENGIIIGRIGTMRDITDRKLTEEKLKTSQAQLSAILESTNDYILLSDKDAKPVYFNSAYAAMMKFLLGIEMKPGLQPHKQLKDKKIQDVWDEYHRRVLSGESFEVESSFPTPDGELMYFRHNFYPIFDTGEIVGFSEFTHNITEGKKSEDALRKSEERYRLVVEDQTELIERFLPDGTLTFVNEALCRFFKLSKEQLLGKSFFPMLLEKDRVVLTEQLSSLTPEEPAKENQMIHIVDGKKYWVSWINRSIFDDNGKLIEHLSVGRDITDMKEAEKALLESEDKFRTLAENTPSAIFIYNASNMVYANPKAEEMLGYTIDEITKQPFWKLIHPDYRDIVKERGFSRLKGENVPSSYEVKIITKFNQTKWVLFSGDLIDYQGEKMVLGTAFDITEKKEAEEKLRLSELEKYQQARQIAGGVAHEIYNALFPAVSSLDKLKNRLNLTNPSDINRNEKLFSLIDTAIERAMNMTDVVTQYSKLDSQANIEKINLKEFIEKLLEENPNIIKQKIQMSLNLDTNANISISRNHLFSLISNLVNNAIDAVSDNEIKKIEIKTELINNKIRIEISDNGQGIPDDIKAKIFNPFFSTKPRTGTGLGLAICKKIVDIYKGDISLQPSIDIGTKFVILLPNKEIN